MGITRFGIHWNTIQHNQNRSLWSCCLCSGDKTLWLRHRNGALNAVTEEKSALQALQWLRYTKQSWRFVSRRLYDYGEWMGVTMVTQIVVYVFDVKTIAKEQGRSCLSKTMNYSMPQGIKLSDKKNWLPISRRRRRFSQKTLKSNLDNHPGEPLPQVSTKYRHEESGLTCIITFCHAMWCSVSQNCRPRESDPFSDSVLKF